MKTKGNGWFLSVVVLFVLGMLHFNLPDVSAAAPQGVLKQAIHWPLSADWLDPSTTGYDVAAHTTLYFLHDALFKPMPDGTYTPCLAESWTVSPDAKVYEFKLRKGVKFHNGDEMTAEDVIFTFWRYKVGQAKFLHERTEKVEAVNPYLVRFQFKEPFPDFFEYLLPGVGTAAWIVPKKYVEKVGDAGFRKHPVGAGPYKYVEFVTGIRFVGEAFEGFWRKVPNVKRIEFHIVTEPATRLAMVRRGEADIGTLMQGVFYEDVKKDPKLRVLAAISPARFLINVSNQYDPKSPWSDLRVRKAASLAIDRQTLADIHMPGCSGIGEIGLPDDPLALQFPVDPYDPPRAKKLLEEAGYPKGFHGGNFYPYQGGYWPFGEQIVNYWKAIGITVDTILLDRPAWLANREAGKFKGSLFIDNPTAPTIKGRMSFLFGTGAHGNYPDVKALWDRYQVEIDPKIRKDLIGQIQRLINERMQWIPLTYLNSPAAIGPRVKGNPYKIQPPKAFPIWFTTPFEDIEIAN